MKILVYEYITGGGLSGESIPPALAREGDLMLQTLVADLRAVSDTELLIPRDPRCPLPAAWAAGPRLSVVPMQDTRNGAAWETLIQECEAVWPIAPETGGVLERLSRDVLKAGKRLLNSAPDAVRISASKYQTCRRLERAGVACVPTLRLEQFDGDFPPPWVVKPDDGVGAEEALIVRDRDELETLKQQPAPNRVVQPLLAGDALSLSALFGAGGAVLLSVNRQRVTVHGDRLVFTGCDVNALAADEGLRALPGALVALIPGLWGYVGIDLLLTPAGPRILEVNPRLTTSYAGLHQALGVNPAALVLDLARGLPNVPLSAPGTTVVEVDLEKVCVH